MDGQFFWLQKVTWKSTLFNDHIRKMEKFFRKRLICLCYVYVSLSKNPLNKKSGVVKSMWIFKTSARTNAQFT